MRIAAAALLALSLATACESTLPTSGPPTAGHAASPSFTSPPIGVVDSPIPAASGWVTFVNHLGNFTYSLPGDWGARGCEDNAAGYVVADPASLPCGTGEYEDAWLLCMSKAGDLRSTTPYRGTLRSQASVVVSGIPGTRYDSAAGNSGRLAPPLGSEVILYVFFSGGRTYSFEYEHWPSMPDRTADFDRSVQSELLFSA